MGDMIIRERDELIGSKIGAGEKMFAQGPCKLVRAYCAQAVVLNTPYYEYFGAYGRTATTKPAAATHKRILVADEAKATGEVAWFAIEGVHDVVIADSAKGTAGDEVAISTAGNSYSTDAAFGATSIIGFGTLLEAKATGTSKTCLCYLNGAAVTWA